MLPVQEIFGCGSAEKLSEILVRLGAKKPFIVTGKASFNKSGGREIIENISPDYDIVFFSEFSPNPLLEEAVEGYFSCRDHGADIIIAIGGGSAIDVAKTINAIYGAPEKAKDIAMGVCPVSEGDALPLIAIPTTAGTGSEATHFAVIYVDEKKYSIASQKLIPEVVILDPRFTDSLSPYLTACTGFDALCQAIESFWAKGATSESCEFATEAIPLILENLPSAVNCPSEEDREWLLYASNLAGKAINISKTTAPHALSYTITSLWGVPHGHAVALTLGAFFIFHEESVGEHHPFYETIQELYQMLGVNSGKSAFDKWYKLMEECGLSSSPSGVNMCATNNIKQIVAGVNLERLSNHPIAMNQADLIKLLKYISL